MRYGYLRVVKCTDGRKWYRNMIGEIVPNHGLSQGEYRSVEPDGYINFISPEDCEVIQDNNVSNVQ